MQATSGPCNLFGVNIHQKIKAAREAKELSQSELARKLGVKPQTVQQWEGTDKKATAPRRSRLKAVADKLGVSPAYLVDDAAPEQSPASPPSTLDRKANISLLKAAQEIAQYWLDLAPELREEIAIKMKEAADVTRRHGQAVPDITVEMAYKLPEGREKKTKTSKSTKKRGWKVI